MRKQKISVIAGVVVAAGLVIVTALFLYPVLPALDARTGSEKEKEPSREDVLYLYLFKENSNFQNSGQAGFYMLYDEMTKDGGLGQITKPSFEQIHYGIGRDGVYQNWLSNNRIDRFSSVKMIISDSIKRPDGLPLKQEDFSPDARFLYSPYYGATLIVENDGTVYVMNQDRYMNPKHLPADRMINVVTLPVEAADFERISSHHGEIKERIENFEPQHLQTPPATILQNPSERFLDNLVLISERTSESIKIRPSASFDSYSSLIDPHSISLRLYHGTNATNGAEMVSISLSNPVKSETISVQQLAISGLVSIGNRSAETELLSRPVISDPYNVIKPTTTNPITIQPGESVMAYIQGNSSFDIDRYAASACYSYNGGENPNLGNQTTYSDQISNNRYCINTIQQEEGSLQNIGYKTRYNHSQIPDLHMIVANTGKSYAGEEGSYCWDNMCADSVEIVPENIIGIDKGSEIEFKMVNYRQPEEFNIYVQSPQPFVPHCIVRYDNATSEEITTCDEPPKIPQLTQLGDAFHYRVEMPTGVYKIWASAIWQTEPPYSQGDASYYYMIQVK